MRALILGAAAGGGLPQWNCGCPNCNAARSGAIAPQSQSSIAVSADGRSWAVLNASPDIRTQFLYNPQMHPETVRGTPVKSVVLTNGDIDHIAGLLILREKTGFDVYATGEIHKALSENPMFGVLDPDHVSMKTMTIGEAFSPAPDVHVTPYFVPGKVPLYQEAGNVDTTMISENTIGLEIKANDKTLQYVPGCAMITDEILERFAESDQILFDGTVWQNEEMKQTATGTKTGRRMGHIPMSGEDGSLAMLGKVEQAGWTVANDGMEIVL